jgi:protein gp37
MHGLRWVGLSIEPQLAPVSILGTVEVRDLDWIIGGDESRHLHHPRPYQIAWARLLIEQCHARDIPYFQKQLGSSAFDGDQQIRTRDPAGADPREWPAWLRVQEMPRVFDREPRRVSQPTLL